MTCDTFRAQFVPATEDAKLLEHLRSCDACLNFAVERDDDVIFRALGGDMIPPGGVDAFVSDVMREVHLRRTEIGARHITGWPRKLAVAATLAAMIAGTTFMVQHRSVTTVPGPAVVHHQFKTVAAKPVIESYDSEKATIVEVPGEGASVTVVMVFDESVPADL